MFLPYSTALRLGKIPWVTITVVVLCTIIYWPQAHNQEQIQQHVQSYCQGNPERLGALFPEKNAAVALNDCQELLTLIHSRPNPEVFFQRLRDSNYLIKIGANRETLVKNLDIGLGFRWGIFIDRPGCWRCGLLAGIFGGLSHLLMWAM